MKERKISNLIRRIRAYFQLKVQQLQQFKILENINNRLMEDDYIVMVNSIEYEKLKRDSQQLSQFRSIYQQKELQLQSVRNEYAKLIYEKQIQANKIKQLNDIIFDLMSKMLRIDQQTQNKHKQEGIRFNKQKERLFETIKKQQTQVICLKQKLVGSENQIFELKKLLLDLKASIKQTHNNLQSSQKKEIDANEVESSNFNIQRQKLLLLTISRILDERSQKAKEAQEFRKLLSNLQKTLQEKQSQLKKQKDLNQNFLILQKQLQMCETQIKHLQQQKNYLSEQLHKKFKQVDSMTQLIKQYQKAEDQKKKKDGITQIVQEAIEFFQNLQTKLKNFGIDNEQDRFDLLETYKASLIKEIKNKIVFERRQTKHKKQKPKQKQKR